MTISKISPRVDRLVDSEVGGFGLNSLIGGGAGVSSIGGYSVGVSSSHGPIGNQHTPGPSIGGSTIGSDGLRIGGIQEYFKNLSEVNNGFSNPSKPISILFWVNCSRLVTKPGPYLNPFWNYCP
jgi:hypothetical protein